MKNPGFRILIVMTIWLTTVSSHAEPVGQLVQRKGSGQVNWSAGIVGVAGREAAATSDSENAAALREMARVNAAAKARLKLLKTLQGLRVDTSYRLDDVTDNNLLIRDQVRAMVAHLPVIQQLETIRPDGSVEVQLLMSIRGGFAQLVLPEEIRKIESITRVFPAKKSPAPTASTPSATPTYTGLIIDARGIIVEPALAPKVLDERLEEAYGPTFASREYAIQHGIVRYYTDMSKAASDPRVAGQPLVIKAMRTAWPGLCDLVVSNVDATKLQSSSKNLMFLRECRVIIVTDPL